VVFS